MEQHVADRVQAKAVEQFQSRRTDSLQKLNAQEERIGFGSGRRGHDGRSLVSGVVEATWKLAADTGASPLPGGAGPALPVVRP